MPTVCFNLKLKGKSSFAQSGNNAPVGKQKRRGEPLDSPLQFSFKTGGLQQINRREQKHPDDIDEMPVPKGGQKAKMPPGRKMPELEPHPAGGQQNQADGDVQPVEAGHRVELAAENPLVEDEFVEFMQVPPFVPLNGKKDGAQKKREQNPALGPESFSFD